jgi:hypothetical protein
LVFMGSSKYEIKTLEGELAELIENTAIAD